jgi:hypothetical protein
MINIVIIVPSIMVCNALSFIPHFPDETPQENQTPRVQPLVNPTSCPSGIGSSFDGPVLE